MKSATAAGSILTGVCATFHYRSFMRKYNERDEECNKLKSELQKHEAKMITIRTNQNRNERAYKCLKSKGKK